MILNVSFFFFSRKQSLEDLGKQYFIKCFYEISNIYMILLFESYFLKGIN